jgi:hypothetical protein
VAEQRVLDDELAFREVRNVFGDVHKLVIVDFYLNREEGTLREKAFPEKKLPLFGSSSIPIAVGELMEMGRPSITSVCLFSSYAPIYLPESTQ